MELTADRVARNDDAFRKANEGISNVAADQGVDGLLPFICECADPRCTEIVRLTLAEYEHVRGRPTWFLNAHGHHVTGGPHVEVVEEHERYIVAEKVGRAAEVAEELDPRERTP